MNFGIIIFVCWKALKSAASHKVLLGHRWIHRPLRSSVEVEWVVHPKKADQPRLLTIFQGILRWKMIWSRFTTDFLNTWSSHESSVMSCFRQSTSLSDESSCLATFPLRRFASLLIIFSFTNVLEWQHTLFWSHPCVPLRGRVYEHHCPQYG